MMPTMPSRSWRTMLTAAAVPLVLAVSSATTLAASNDDDTPPPDARLEGYARNGPVAQGQSTALLINPQSGTAGTWFMIVIFSALCLGVMCKSGKRTHLD